MEGGVLVHSALPGDFAGGVGGHRSLLSQSPPPKGEDSPLGAPEPAPLDPWPRRAGAAEPKGLDLKRIKFALQQSSQEQQFQPTMQQRNGNKKGGGDRPNPGQTEEPMHVQAMMELANSMAVMGLDPSAAGGVGMMPGQDGGMDMSQQLAMDGSIPAPADWGETTTVMMRNLPNKYTQHMLLEEINATCLGAYDFLYLPIDPETAANRGYAFINFITPSIAWTFKTFFDGRKMNRFNSNKVVSVVPATLQGFEANYAHYASARVNRGDPAARPLFLRGPQATPSGQGGMRNRRNNRGGGGGGGGDRLGQAANAMPQAPPQLLWQVAAAMASTAQNMPMDASGGMMPYVMNGDGGGGGGGPGAGAMVPKFCPHCGGSIQKAFQFCPHCGASLDFNQG